MRSSGGPEQLSYIAGDSVMKTLRLEAGEVKTVTLRGIEIGASIPARWELHSQEENVIHVVACIGFRYGRKEAKVTTGCTLYGWKWPIPIKDAPSWAVNPYVIRSKC